MTVQPLGIAGATADAIVSQQQARQARDDQKENTTRDARNSFTYSSTGVGSLKLNVPVEFDCQFVEEPHIGAGVAIQVGPDEHYYELPQCTVGVYRWVKTPQQPKPKTDSADPPAVASPTGSSGGGDTVYNAEDTEPMFYTGAYLFMRVECALKDGIAPLLAEQHPASPRLHHHISFFGTAMKALPTTVTDTAGDPNVTPRTTDLTGGAGS